MVVLVGHSTTPPLDCRCDAIVRVQVAVKQQRVPCCGGADRGADGDLGHLRLVAVQANADTVAREHLFGGGSLPTPTI